MCSGRSTLDFAALVDLGYPSAVSGSCAGLDLKLHESGDSVRKVPNISCQGKSLLRYWLYLAAVIVTRYEGPFRELYLRRQESSPGLGSKKRALIAVSDKLVRVIFAMLRDQRRYDANRDQLMERRYAQLKRAA